MNAVCPGWTETEMAAPALTEPGRLERITQTMPLRKVAQPDDVAWQIVVLASDRLSGHVSGQVVVVAGGMEGRLLHESVKHRLPDANVSPRCGRRRAAIASSSSGTGRPTTFWKSPVHRADERRAAALDGVGAGPVAPLARPEVPLDVGLRERCERHVARRPADVLDAAGPQAEARVDGVRPPGEGAQERPRLRLVARLPVHAAVERHERVDAEHALARDRRRLAAGVRLGELGRPEARDLGLVVVRLER